MSSRPSFLPDLLLRCYGVSLRRTIEDIAALSHQVCCMFCPREVVPCLKAMLTSPVAQSLDLDYEHDHCDWYRAAILDSAITAARNTGFKCIFDDEPS